MTVETGTGIGSWGSPPPAPAEGKPAADETGNGDAKTPEPAAATPTEEEFRCEEHNKTFKNKQGLRLHLTRAHGAARVSSKDRTKPGKKVVQVATPVTPTAAFNGAKVLAQVTPAGHVPTEHFERVHAWLEEAKKLHSLLG